MININSLMSERGISGYRLARMSGASESAISAWRAGKTKPSVKALCSIADVLGVTVDYLLDRVPNNIVAQKAKNKKGVIL